MVRRSLTEGEKTALSWGFYGGLICGNITGAFFFYVYLLWEAGLLP